MNEQTNVWMFYPTMLLKENDDVGKIVYVK